MPTCCVCGDAMKKQYRCSRCLLPYCSVQCSKQHRGTDLCIDAALERAKGAEIERQAREADVFLRGKPSATTTSEDFELLDEAHLGALANDRYLRDALRTAELRSLLRIIDNSRSRLDALDAAMHNVPQFNDFCQKVLGVIYSVHRSQGAPSN